MPILTMQQIDDLLKKRLKNFATKDDLKQFATKDDLKQFATKDDLKQFATKDDLKQLEKNLTNRIEDAVVQIIEVTDKTKADKKQVDELEKRIELLST